MHVLGHPPGVAADIEISAVLEPGPEFGGLFAQAVLNARELVFTDLIVVLLGAVIGIFGSFVAIRRFLDV